jgi:hypothetical protein
MTPQEKAEDLFMMYVNKGMNQIKPVINRVIRKEMAKQCALIAVDEIINCDSFFKTLEDTKAFTKYWYEVQQEIEKL